MMTDRNKTQQIAQAVREAIAQIPPFESMTLDVDELGIVLHGERQQGMVACSCYSTPWPKRMYALYEALAEVEGILQEERGLDVLLFPGEPSEKVAAEVH